MFLILKRLCIVFKARVFVLEWVTDDPMGQAILLITQNCHLSSFLMILFKALLFTFCPAKKRL